MSNFIGHKKIHHPDGSTPDCWHQYTCGHCNKDTSGAIVAQANETGGVVKWLECTSCGNGSVMTLNGQIYPGVKYGPNLEGLPPDVSSAYSEARDCMSVNAYTACELICRKILMHTAVDKGEKEGLHFVEYITYLESKGYVTPPMSGWVKLIKDHGNESTHKIEKPDKTRAESTLIFTAELLRLVYEMEHLSNKYTKNNP